VYGPRCNDGAGKAFSRPTSISAIPGSGAQLLSNIRAEDVAAAVFYLSSLDSAVGEAFNLAEDSHPALGEALIMASTAFGTKPPKLHLPLWLVKTVAWVDGKVFSAQRTDTGFGTRRRYDISYNDYIVDNSKLKSTGYRMIYPDFEESMKQMGVWYRAQAS